MTNCPFSHLAAGTGYIEHVEIDWQPRWGVGDDIPTPSQQKRWTDQYLQGMDSIGRSARVDSTGVKTMLEDAGFTDLREDIIRCYINPWTDNEVENEKAQWLNLAYGQALPAMSYVPFVRHGGFEKIAVDAVCRAATTESRILRYHAYYNL